MEGNNELFLDAKILDFSNQNYNYNKKEGKHPFLLQFKQLKYYYNLRKQFKNIVSLGYFSKEDEKCGFNQARNISQNMYCLIDRKWLKKWKKHVGYKEIKNKIKEDKIEREIENNDYKWISEIIDKNYKENYLNPLDNNSIYKDNEINPLVDFKVIHKNSFKLFNIISNNLDKDNYFRKYPLRLFKDKYFVYLNSDMIFIAVKNINSNKFNEIIVDFIEKREENKRNTKKIIENLIIKDINNWLKEINYYNEIEKELEYFNC